MFYGVREARHTWKEAGLDSRASGCRRPRQSVNGWVSWAQANPARSRCRRRSIVAEGSIRSAWGLSSHGHHAAWPIQRHDGGRHSDKQEDPPMKMTTFEGETNRTVRRLGALAVVLAALVAAGCGSSGYSGSSSSSSSATPATSSSSSAAPETTSTPAASASGIPQNGGGDGDGDNSGGPSDGDGNL